MGRPLCVVLGLASIGVGVWGVARWWPLSVTVLKAALPPVLILGGLIAVVAGVTEIRETSSKSSASRHEV